MPGPDEERGVSRSQRVVHALSLSVLAIVSALDLVIGRGQVVTGLLVIGPLVAATALGRRATIGYGVLALVLAVPLGVYNDQYSADTLLAQSIRLAGIAVGSVVAVVVCTLRLRREGDLARMSARAATAAVVVRTAETLQRNLLGDAPRPDGWETAVRYVPASRHAQVGGDWYDVFGRLDGTTMLVIGDVAGHDAPAAATMAQARGMLRGVACATGASPAVVLTALDRAFECLAIRTLVTVTVATLDVDQAAGRSSLCWSNAGHPAPILIRADGTTRLLERPPERLIGVSPDARRRNHEQLLHPGDAVLFYTDGLIERGHVPLDEGTAWLLREVQRLAGEPLDRLCDGLLQAIGGPVDDDVALLVVRLPHRAAPSPAAVTTSASLAADDDRADLPPAAVGTVGEPTPGV
jgi:serine phosphatase RsbU (regulator of sigma subunit)